MRGRVALCARASVTWCASAARALCAQTVTPRPLVGAIRSRAEMSFASDMRPMPAAHGPNAAFVSRPTRFQGRQVSAESARRQRARTCASERNYVDFAGRHLLRARDVGSTGRDTFACCHLRLARQAVAPEIKHVPTKDMTEDDGVWENRAHALPSLVRALRRACACVNA